jgi:hypothetical protein
LFAESEDILEKLADEALAEHAQVKTKALDINKPLFPKQQSDFVSY